MNFSDAVFGKPVEVKPWILDRSTLEGFAECPFRAQLALKDPLPVGDLAQVGIEIHRLIHEAFEWCKGDSALAPADYFQQEGPKARPDIQPEVLQAARHVASELGRINMNRILGVEYQVDFQLPISIKGRPVKITTAIDLLLQGQGDTSLVVFDWKTGYKKRTNSDAANSFQAQFISYILFQLYPTVQTVHFFYVETRFGTRAYARYDRKEVSGFSTLTTEHAIQTRIMESVRYWSEDSYEAWPEPNKCAWCDYTKSCPHIVGDVKDLATNEAAFVDQFVVLKARMDAMKKAATAWIKGGKGVKLSGSCVTLEKTRPSNRFDLSIYKQSGQKEEEDNGNE